MLNTFWNIAIFIVTLSILITVHELGHLYVARKCGVLVKRFSIGFGKKLWRYFDHHGTEFVISIIPLGGYIKMLDEHSESVIPTMSHCAFNNKTFYQQIMIIIAGPLANFIFAVFAYWLVFIVNVPNNMKPIIGDVIPNSIAASAQIFPGMELKAIDKVKTPDWDAVKLQLLTKVGVDQITLSVTSFDSDKYQEKILDLRNWDFKSHKEDLITTLGIRPFYRVHIEPILIQVKKKSAAGKAGLLAGDKIIKVNGQPLTHWIKFVYLVNNNKGRPLILDIERQGVILSIKFIPDNRVNSGITKCFAGMIPKTTPLSNDYKILNKYWWFHAILAAINKTWQLTKLTIKTLGKLMTGSIKLNNLSGPISVAHAAGVSAKLGITYYLKFLAIISINLGVINLFPLYILDGGHVLFLAIEKLNGHSISENIKNISYRISFILLILFTWITLINDLSTFVK